MNFVIFIVYFLFARAKTKKSFKEYVLSGIFLIFRNDLIKISLFCRETEITNFVHVINDLDALYKRYSPELEDLFEKTTFT